MRSASPSASSFTLVVAAVCLLALSATSLQAAQRCEGKTLRGDAGFTILGDGVQVLDTRTGLIWLRCLEGQTWTGTTCKADDPKAVNPAPGMTFDEARAYARSRSTADEQWRVPTKRELVDLREPGCYNPSLNLRIFPTEPAWSSDGHYWSSTPEAEGVSLVDAIGASDAWTKTGPDKKNHVRLVRTPPKKRE